MSRKYSLDEVMSMAGVLSAEVPRFHTADEQHCAVEMLRAYAATLRQQAARVDTDNLPDYDAGLFGDGGGGDVGWWQDYLRAEIGRANDHWRCNLEAALSAQPAPERQGAVGEVRGIVAHGGGKFAAIEYYGESLPYRTKLYAHPAAPVGVPDGDSGRIDWLESNARSVSFGKAPQQGYWVHVQGVGYSGGSNKSLRDAIDAARAAHAAEIAAAPSAPQGTQQGEG